MDRKLTLISASAGFGKTTLASEWIAGCGRPAAWLSLDEGDNDPARFLAHLVAALRAIAEPIGESADPVLDSPQPPQAESILTILLNEISALPFRFVLVLDDYHVINAKPVDDALAFLLEHLPPQMHLAIITRENPQLPLGRLRARGHLTELRDADLRFTEGEAAAFLEQVMGLGLTADDARALAARTEGWIAGLQLAALSMQGREDISAFIRAFAGDHRYIVDYLVEEVLQRQPEPVRRFLLQTSVLDRLYGPLCDAVTGQKDGTQRLQFLEQGSYFIVPLDDKRLWYRYHHLFAEVLSAHLKADRPEQVAMLHRRASEWYERHGSDADAIRHALAAGDATRAADLIEQAWPAMRRSRQEASVLGWLKAIPDEMVRNRPVLSVEYAWALLANGQLEAVEARLRDAERWLELTSAAPSAESTVPLTGMVVVDEEEYRCLPGTIAGYRSARAQVLGDAPAAIRYARQVLELVPEHDHLRRGAAAALLGLAAWTGGDLREAHRMFADGMVNVQLAGNFTDVIGGAIALADLSVALGRLRQAKRTYEEGLELAARQNGTVLRGTADMYVGLGALCLEQGDPDAALQHLNRSRELGEHMGLPQHRYRWYTAMAQIREAQGDPDGALELLHEAERLYRSDFFPNIRPVGALKTRIWLAQGRVGEALDWARGQALSFEDELHYLREYEHITLARVLLARYKNDREERCMMDAAALLDRLLRAAQEGGRTGSEIEILIVQALAHRMKGDTSAALMPLERALALAEPESYVRSFVAEGRPMASLLESAAKQGIVPGYVRHLLGAFGLTVDSTKAQPDRSEPLSEREQEVLHLLRTDMSGPDIARRLHISLNTLRTHTKNIFAKLGVSSRLAAIRRADELGLFHRPD